MTNFGAATERDGKKWSMLLAWVVSNSEKGGFLLVAERRASPRVQRSYHPTQPLAPRRLFQCTQSHLHGIAHDTLPCRKGTVVFHSPSCFGRTLHCEC